MKAWRQLTSLLVLLVVMAISHTLNAQYNELIGETTIGNALRAVTSENNILVAASDSPNSVVAIANYRCDGAADDVEINAAIDALPSGGGRVILGPGTFSVSGTITLGSNTELMGCGPGSIIKMADTGEGSLTGTDVPYRTDYGGGVPPIYSLIRTDQTARTYDIYLHDFAIDGNGANIQAVDYCVAFAGLLVYQSDRCVVERLHIKDCNHLIGTDDLPLWQSFCVLFKTANDCKLIGGTFGNAGYESIGIRGDDTLRTLVDGVAVIKSDDVSYGNHGLQCSRGGVVDMPYQGTRIVNSTFSGRASHIIVHSAANITIENCVFRIPTLDQLTGYGVILRDAATNVIVSGCHFFGGESGPNHGVYMDGGATLFPSHCVIDNCVIRVPGDCIRAAGKNIVIRDNSLYAWGLRTIHVENTDSVPVEDFVIEGNTCQTTAVSTAQPTTLNLIGVTRAVVSANDFMPLTNYRGIYLSNSSEIQIRDNKITVAGSGVSLYLNGTNTWAASGNVGFSDTNSGTATVASGATTVDVTHGLGFTPTSGEIVITPTNNLGNASHFWISDIGATTFRINVDSDPGATTATFAWRAGRPIAR